VREKRKRFKVKSKNLIKGKKKEVKGEKEGVRLKGTKYVREKKISEGNKNTTMDHLFVLSLQCVCWSAEMNRGIVHVNNWSVLTTTDHYRQKPGFVL